jgi:hypothetical protein
MTKVQRENLANAGEPEIFCNKCSMSCRGHVGNFNGLIEARVDGAYDSSHLEDGAVYIFSLCEKCLTDLFSTFKLDPYKGNFIILDSHDAYVHPDVEEEFNKIKGEREALFEDFRNSKEDNLTPIEDIIK